MTASSSKSRARPQRRIIERPRLTKLLDATDARTILLIAPAGYGKTTLARQWAKTLNGAIWVTLTPAHRDVSVLALELARGTAPDGAAEKFIREYVQARANPQRVAREVATTVSEQLASARIQWVILDDYHELGTSPEADLFIDVLHSLMPARFMIASRLRPEWVTRRLVVYGEALELTREVLAMTPDESQLVVGARSDRESLAVRAQGWPAVLGLAARTGARAPTEATVPAALYEYFLQEIYQQAPGPLREDIAAMALAGDLSEGSLERMFRARQVAVVDAARDLGFLSTVGEPLELHPLVKSFVLDKLAAEGRVDDLIRPAAIRCLREERWERAFELIGHFDLSDLVEEAIELAYGPLVRRGQLGTLSAFAARVRTSATFPPPVADLVDAEIALRDGAFRLARQIADRVQVSLPPRHPLGSKANAIVGHSAFAEADVQEVDRAYRRAYELARSDDDRGEVLRFWALASVQTEVPGSSTIVAKLATRRHLSPLDLLRYETVELVCQHFAGGTIDLQRFDEGLHVLAQAEDPRARSSFANAAAYLSMLAGDYDRASELMTLADADIESYDLDFARPHSHCNNAFIALGKRQFAKADRLIRRLEDLADRYPVGYHVLNARVLRARLAMQTNQIDTALAALAPAAHESAIPSIHGEYLATRALAMAIAGNAEPAEEAADAAAALTSATEVQVLISAVRAVKDAKDGEPNGAVALWDVASKANVWDPVVLSARASAPLAGALAKIGGIKSQLERLYDRSSDQALARKAGLRIRTRREPKEVLSPREFEVLELLARGYRSRDIAEALVISPSTTKVHIRHIMEKLGVRTRAEAVARASLAL